MAKSLVSASPVTTKFVASTASVPTNGNACNLTIDTAKMVLLIPTKELSTRGWAQRTQALFLLPISELTPDQRGERAEIAYLNEQKAAARSEGGGSIRKIFGHDAKRQSASPFHTLAPA